MPRYRTIKPEFWSSEQVMECSPIARLLFIGLWNFCDDAGRHRASLKTLKAEVFPSDSIATEEIARLVLELVANGLLDEYEVGDEKYWQVTGWKHQKIDQPTYRFPGPNGTVERSPNRRRTNGERAEASRVESNGVECKGNESKVDSIESSKSVVDLEDAFASNHVSKQLAREVRTVSKADRELLGSVGLLVSAKRIPEQWAFDSAAAVAAKGGKAKNPIAYFRSCLEGHCEKSGVDLSKLLGEASSNLGPPACDASASQGFEFPVAKGPA